LTTVGKLSNYQRIQDFGAPKETHHKPSKGGAHKHSNEEDQTIDVYLRSKTDVSSGLPAS
jgi:hypothetical protein